MARLYLYFSLILAIQLCVSSYEKNILVIARTAKQDNIKLNSPRSKSC